MADADPDRTLVRADFAVVTSYPTRWADNDMFGHLNNAVYYQLFDTTINQWVGAGTGVDIFTAPAMALTAESSCRFFRELGFPRPVDIGLRVQRIGRSSVAYQLGAFPGGADPEVPEPLVAALGYWVHVYVDRDSRKPVEMPTVVRRLLETACAHPAS